MFKYYARKNSNLILEKKSNKYFYKILRSYIYFHQVQCCGTFVRASLYTKQTSIQDKMLLFK